MTTSSIQSLPRRALTVTAAIAFAVVSVGGSTSGPRDPIVATVSGHPIFSSDFERRWQETKLSFALRRRPLPQPDSQAGEQLRRAVLRKTVLRMILRLEAERLGMHVSDARVRERINEIKLRIFKGDREAYRADLRRKQRTEADLVADLRDQLVAAGFLDRALRQAHISDGKVRSYFTRHRREYAIGEHRRIEFVVFSKRDGAVAFKRAAEKAPRFPAQYAQVRQTAVALRSSLAASGAVFVLRLPATRWSGPFLLRRMWYVIRPLGAVQPPRPLSLSEVRLSIEQKLRREEARMIHRNFVQQAWRRYGSSVKYREPVDSRP